MKRPDGVVLISIYHGVVAALGLVMLCFMAVMPLLVAATMVGTWRGVRGVLAMFVLATAAAFFLLLGAVAYAVVGLSLIHI